MLEQKEKKEKKSKKKKKKRADSDDSSDESSVDYEAISDDDMSDEGLDTANIIPGGRRTRGVRTSYKQFDFGDSDDSD